MHIEHSLAASRIVKLMREGYSKQCATVQAAKFVKSQGFGAKYAKQIAEQMADLVSA